MTGPGSQKLVADLRAENSRLRDEIDELNEALRQTRELHKSGGTLAALMQMSFGLAPQEAKVLAKLYEAGERSIEQLLMTCPAKYRDQQVDDPKLITVLVSRIRAKVKPFGITLKTIWGHGYALEPKSKAKVAEVLESKGLTDLAAGIDA